MGTATINFTEAFRKIVLRKLERIIQNNYRAAPPRIPYELFQQAMHIEAGDSSISVLENKQDSRYDSPYCHFLFVDKHCYCCCTDFPIDGCGDRVE